MSDSGSDVPDLEPLEGETPLADPELLLIDYRALNQGDPAAPGKGLSAWAGIAQGDLRDGDSQRAFDLALSLRAEALRIFREKPNTAIMKITDAVVLCPSSAIMLCSRAKILYELGEISAAVRDLEVARQRNGQHAPTRLLLAKCYNLLCETEKALAECRAAQAVDFTEEGQALQKELEKRLAEQREREAEEERRKREAAASGPVEDLGAGPGEPGEPGGRAAGGPGRPAGAGEPASFKDRLYAEIGELKQRHGEAALPPAFRVLDNLETEARNLSAGRAQKLMADEKVMKAFSDPEFQRKLDEMGKDPAKAAEYMKDKDFMEGFQAVLRCMA